MRAFILIGALIIASASLGAQESRPASKPKSKPQVTTKPTKEKLERDPAALKAFKAVTSQLYRPREHGLKSVQFQFTVSYSFPDGRKLDYGPYLVDWDVKTGHTIKFVGEKTKSTIQPSQMSPGFVERVINDFIGWVPQDAIGGRHVTLNKKKQIVIRVPKKDEARTNVRRMVLTVDKAGRLGNHSILGVKDYPLMIREYDYVAGRKRVLVENTRITAGKTRKVKTHTYVDVAGFTFPAKVKSQGAQQGTQEIIYSKIKVPETKKN